MATEIKKNHLKISDYTIQYDRVEGFIILNKDGEQVSYGYDHVTDAIEQVLMFND